MNVVFWLLVVVTLVLLWFSLSPWFDRIGAFFINLLNDVKDGIRKK